MTSFPKLIVLTILTFILFSCAQKSSEKQDNAEESMSMEMDHSAHADMQMGANTPSDESIYNVSSLWKNRDGKEITLKELSGKVQVVAMVYTHCEYACPRILADMKRIEKELSTDELKQVNFLIVSIDPERDTPERFRGFADENKLEQENWTLLNGDQGDILEFAALLGVKYKRISETDFTHSNMITVLNKEGEVVHQRLKLSDDTNEILTHVRGSL